ncbi:MAG TPA: proline dehydrogenase family protein [bacterium]|nr:proline dehydrogenase family protein [bacterium]
MLTRRLILLLAGSPAIRRLVRRYGMRLGAARFVAGETLDQAVQVLRGLNRAGLLTNTTFLGEGVGDETAARAVTAAYIEILDRIAREGLLTNPSVKLTHLGLDVSEELAYANVRRLAEHAAALGNFVRIDMEDSPRVDPTLRLYRRLRAEGFANVGIVLQAYLRRTPADLEALLPLRPNLRLVKGAYLEPPAVAYPRKADVDRAYIALMERMLVDASFTAIATHDERIIEHAIAFIARRGIPPERFEFQMLYGVRPALQLALVRRGYRVRVATPYGEEWYPYLMRRLAERPANVLFMLRNLLRG